MYITNRNIVIPKEFKIMNNSIQAEHFKLLDIIIDNKLSFAQHVLNVRNDVFTKLYYILKRLSYLSYQVKVQFFKTFLFPHFD